MYPYLSEEEKEKAISYVVSYLCSDYKYPVELAIEIINKSPFILLLDEEPKYVLHYNFEYWAKELHEWYQTNK